MTGAVTKRRDRMVRTALYEAASVMLTPTACLLSSRPGGWRSPGAAARGRLAWPWHASLASSFTARGSMAPASAGPMRRLRSHRRKAFRSGRLKSAPPRSRRWDGEVGEAGMSEVAGRPRSTDYAGKISSPLPPDRIEWQLRLTRDRSKDQRQDKPGQLDARARYRKPSAWMSRTGGRLPFENPRLLAIRSLVWGRWRIGAEPGALAGVRLATAFAPQSGPCD